MINVRDFGASGDGVADDTAAIQSALTAASAAGGVLYLPAGTYRTTAELTVDPYRISVVGDGPQLTIVKPELGSGQFALTLGWDPAAESGWKRGPFNALSGLTIALPTGPGQANGIRVDAQGATGAAHSMTFRDLSLVGGEVQIDLQDQVYLTRFERVFFDEPNLYGLRVDNPSNTGENISFDSCVFARGSGTGVYLNKSGASLKFQQCSFDYIARAVWQRAGLMTFVACHFETGTANGAPGREFLLLDRRGFVSKPMMALTDCYVFTVPATYDTFVRCKGDNGDQGLRITNPYIGLSAPTETMCPYLVRDDGPSPSSIVVSGAWFVRSDTPASKIRKQTGADVTVPVGDFLKV